MKKSEPIDTDILELDFESESKKFSDYFGIIKSNIVPITIIFVISMIVTVIYIKNYPTVYKSVTVVKIDKPQSIFESQTIFLQVQMSERMLQNQLEVMRSYYIRDVVAKSLIDSLAKIGDYSAFTLLVNKSGNKVTPLSQDALRKRLANMVKFELKKGVDAVMISCEGRHYHEVQLITNVYGEVFINYSKELNRQDITNVKNFLEVERSKKLDDLNRSEAKLEEFHKRAGFVVLDDKARTLIDAISRYDAEKNSLEIELKANENSLAMLKKQLDETDSKLFDYIEGQITQPYVSELQRQIAELEVKRDIELAVTKDPKVIEKVRSDYDAKISKLKENLDQKTEILRAGVIARSPDELRNLSQRVFDAKLISSSLRIKSAALKNLLTRYEAEFSQLPAESIEAAKLERERATNEKLYITLEEKYQEATINERSRFGSASMIEPGFDTTTIVAPNKNLILLTGIIVGIVLGLLFAFVRNFLDKTIKTPEQLEEAGFSVLSWIPSFKELLDEQSPETDFVVELKPTASVSEAFKALRTRIQYSKLEEKPLKSILITSTIPSEGKTIMAVNLAGSFAQAGKNTLLLDCDLRKPRIHNIFKTERYPGLSDYLFNNVKFEDIIRKAKMDNLSYVTSGTIPPNPSEILGSVQMQQFLKKLEEFYEIIIIDSPPFISVTDSEILFNITDGTILVARSHLTPFEPFYKTYRRLLTLNPKNLLGCVLNNFAFKSSYGYYYNYYYYYSRPESKGKKKENT
jgi:tyrosine-protein kinase Etk/Wzc